MISYDPADLVPQMEARKTDKLSSLICLAILFCVAIHTAQGQGAGIEYNGQVYQSFAEVREASASLVGAITQHGGVGLSSGIPVNEIRLNCGVRLTSAVLARGHYDGRYDPVVCFTSEAESDQLYAGNLALRRQSRLDVNASDSGFPDASAVRHGHYVCQETPRGAPFRWALYSGAFDDVCPSHNYSNLGNFVRSYWQVGSGRTYFYFADSNLHWWLDGSSAAVGGMMDSYVIRHYTWGA